IGVEANTACSMYNELTGRSNRSLTFDTIAEGINVKEPGKLTAKIVKEYVDEIVTVSDEEIAAAILYMLERNKMLMEGAGAASLAALFKYHDQIQSRHCGVIVSGGNIDINMMPKIQQLAA